MEKTSYILVALAIFSILVISCTPVVETKVMEKDVAMNKDTSTEDKTMQKEDEQMKKDDSVMEKETTTKEDAMEKGASSFKGKILAGTTSPYIEFSKEDYDTALKANKKILLYFYASWCPLCRAEEPKTFAAFNELNDPNLVGFKVNYKDSQTDADEEALAKEFGVAYQHTKVILKDGKKVGKFPDSWDRQRYLDELGKI